VRFVPAGEVATGDGGHLGRQACARVSHAFLTWISRRGQ
jgi:hypothetical protein